MNDEANAKITMEKRMEYMNFVILRSRLTVFIIECINMTSAITNKMRPTMPVTNTNLSMLRYYSVSIIEVNSESV